MSNKPEFKAMDLLTHMMNCVEIQAKHPKMALNSTTDDMINFHKIIPKLSGNIKLKSIHLSKLHHDLLHELINGGDPFILLSKLKLDLSCLINDFNSIIAR